MSFDKMKVPALREVAETFGVDIEGLKLKGDIVKALDDDGVTFEDWEGYNNRAPEPQEPEPAPAKKETGPVDVIKMIRENFYYEVLINNNKYIFEQTHPYVPMPREDAMKLFETEEGFIMANPAEIKSFYN